jgi:SAM-dependent methyltransferase
MSRPLRSVVPSAGSVMAGVLFRLNLGCCDRSIDGYLGVDRMPGPAVDIVADLTRRWPWHDNSVEKVKAHDIIEHLPDKIFTMNELHRVLVPGGQAEIIVPTTDGRGAWQDPTHVSFWNRNSFWYFTDGSPYRTRFAKSYGITACFRVVDEVTQTTADGPKLLIVLAKV